MVMLFKIVSVFLFFVWPLALFTSIMSFDAPGSENDYKHLINVVRILCYPIYLSALYWVFGTTLFGFSGMSLFISSVIIVGLGLKIFGYLDKIIKHYNN